eukprot:CAMPEP_0174277368 /NCGR_PEP_ID=MMETSP0439-20130205/60892_1 /TAXON_ID=0 /ORGANISM="Stereomyxa ramosa, Strain Chinc5" /LENGTH=949 /DNA_ID=CAMNT_0015369679 /DNA_START=1045 /DNA_END=3890 /DNA_ORIENTATION=-
MKVQPSNFLSSVILQNQQAPPTPQILSVLPSSVLAGQRSIVRVDFCYLPSDVGTSTQLWFDREPGYGEDFRIDVDQRSMISCWCPAHPPGSYQVGYQTSPLDLGSRVYSETVKLTYVEAPESESSLMLLREGDNSQFHQSENPLHDIMFDADPLFTDVDEIFVNDIFMKYCATGQITLVKEILERKEDIIDARDDLGNTPLHYASFSGHLDTVIYLISSGSKINETNKFNLTPYHYSSLRGHHHISLFLVQYEYYLQHTNSDKWVAEKKLLEEVSKCFNDSWRILAPMVVTSQLDEQILNQFDEDLENMSNANRMYNLSSSEDYDVKGKGSEIREELITEQQELSEVADIEYKDIGDSLGEEDLQYTLEVFNNNKHNINTDVPSEGLVNVENTEVETDKIEKTGEELKSVESVKKGGTVEFDEETQEQTENKKSGEVGAENSERPNKTDHHAHKLEKSIPEEQKVGGTGGDSDQEEDMYTRIAKRNAGGSKNTPSSDVDDKKEGTSLNPKDQDHEIKKVESPKMLPQVKTYKRPVIKKEGYLLKLGVDLSVYKAHQRWFTVTDDLLEYYKDKNGTEKKGSIELEKTWSIEIVHKAKWGEALQIVTPSRTYQLMPLSGQDPKQELSSWLLVLRLASKKNVEQPSRISSRLGPFHRSKKHRTEILSSSTNENFGQGNILSLFRAIPWLQEDNSQKLEEFHQIWLNSFPSFWTTKRQANKNNEFKFVVNSNFNEVTWYLGGGQGEVIQGMVDFFWNVGAPESEIDRLNDVGAICNPCYIGSWISMSHKGAMDGGWYFPTETLVESAFEAVDKNHEDFELLKNWLSKYDIKHTYLLSRDMGAAAPRQTQLQFELPGCSFEEQCRQAKESITDFDFPDVPFATWNTLIKANVPGLRFSITITGEGIARIGVLFPNPTQEMINKLTIREAGESINQVGKILSQPKYVEYFNLNSG